jgi:hypothetical protein
MPRNFTGRYRGITGLKALYYPNITTTFIPFIIKIILHVIIIGFC